MRSYIHRRRLCTALLLLVGACAAWWAIGAFKPSSRIVKPAPLKTGVVTTAIDAHRSEGSYTQQGDPKHLPSKARTEDTLQTPGLSYVRRMQALRALKGSILEAHEADALRSFVADPMLPDGMTWTQLRALKNNVLNLLDRQPGEAAALANAVMLREVLSDEQQDGAVRDYALQHLALLAERESAVGWSTHWHLIESDETALAATGLIHLALQHRDGVLTAEESARLSAVALRLASDPNAKDPARTTALQVCSQLKIAGARQVAEEIARSTSVGLIVRIAAVAALGDMEPDPTIRSYLAELANGPEKRLRVPAQVALQKLSIN